MPKGVYERKGKAYGRPKVSAIERFWSKVDYNFNENGCLEWIGSLNTKGYGQLFVNGKNITSHRFSYELFYQKIPKGMVVMHSCDNPKCVNPNHLSIGTFADNTKDAINKNRLNSKLTIEQVKEIKNKLILGIKQAEIAEEYGIAPSNVGSIKNGKSWKHVNI